MELGDQDSCQTGKNDFQEYQDNTKKYIKKIKIGTLLVRMIKKKSCMPQEEGVMRGMMLESIPTTIR